MVALVTARGGSKGLPGKNIRLLAGKPLIAWSIEAALQSAAVDRVVVSTDDEEIAESARSAGAEVPFVRPSHLATDPASSTDVILHALDWLYTAGDPARYFVLLQPTSPLRTAADLDGAAARMRSGASAVIAVSPVREHPYLMLQLGADGAIGSFLLPGGTSARRQDMAEYYCINGALYMADRDYFVRQGGFYGPHTSAYVMPRERSIDIDDETDFLLAETFMSRRGVTK